MLGEPLWDIFMNQRDRELLDKQLKWIVPTSRHNGAIILVMVGIFVAGIALGSTLSAHEAQSTPAASDIR